MAAVPVALIATCMKKLTFGTISGRVIPNAERAVRNYCFSAARAVLNAIKHAVARRAAAAPDRVMAAEGVVDDLEHRIGQVRIKDMPGGQ